MSSIPNTNYSNYIMNPDNQITGMRLGGRLNQAKILTYEDGSEWVFLTDKGKERFCGFLYLQNALKESNIENIEAAENKIAIYDKKIIYLSKYYGDEKPDPWKNLDKIQAIRKTGFSDLSNCANLREQNGKTYIFDTEKFSFNPDVHNEIDSFAPVHDEIIESLLQLASEQTY